MSQKQELKPLHCPFCAAEPKVDEGIWIVSHAVNCFFTKHYAQETNFVDRRLDNWNTRPDSDRLRKAVGEAVMLCCVSELVWGEVHDLKLAELTEIARQPSALSTPQQETPLSESEVSK